MKHEYPNAQLQTAIDEACEEAGKRDCHIIGKTLWLSSETLPDTWKLEASIRLSLARALLARLPEPTPAIVDPYAELKAAHAAGKVIQVKRFDRSHWDDWDREYAPKWYLPANEYRIKPTPSTFPAATLQPA